MRSVIFAVVVLCVVLGISGCSKSDGGEESSTESSSSTTEQLLSLNLTTPNTELEEGKEITLTLSGDYSRGASKPITSNITWIIDNTSILNIHNTTLRALKEGTATIRAKVDGRLSQKLTITVYRVIEGHRLPPEPNEKLNNLTLLGVDVNDNGVRDDVERWIYETYKDKHPIYIDIAMQEGRANKLVLETPEKALEIHDEVNKATYCQLYYRLNAKYFSEPILIQENAVNEYFRSEIYFNTKERMDAYIKYDTLLSGGVYTLLAFKERKAACDFNTSKYEE